MPSRSEGRGGIFRNGNGPLLISILAFWVTCGCQGCAPGCQPLLQGVDGEAALEAGACYYVSSSASTVALSVPSTSNTQPTWASVPATQPPVLDLCNQVQQVSLPGERVSHLGDMGTVWVLSVHKLTESEYIEPVHPYGTRIQGGRWERDCSE